MSFWKVKVGSLVEMKDQPGVLGLVVSFFDQGGDMVLVQWLDCDLKQPEFISFLRVVSE